MQETPDSLLAKKVRQGNKNAFDQLFFKYYSSLYHFAFNFCNDSVIAEESVQKTFIKIWKNRSEFPLNNIGKTLFVCTKNSIIDEIRKNNARKKYEGTLVYETVIENKNTDDTKHQIKAIIESAIEQLPKKAKEIFRLAKQEGLSIQEIANYLNLSNKTVENQLTIAYKKLRKYLEPFKNELNF